MNPSEKYQKRRSLLGNTYSRTLFVIPSGQVASRSHSVKYRFKSASDFFYLVGHQVAGAILIILGEKTYLLHEPQVEDGWGESMALTGEMRTPSQGIHFDSLIQLETIIRSYRQDFDRIAVSLDRDKETEAALLSLVSYDRKLRSRKGMPISLCDSRTLVGTARLVKEPDEIECLRESGSRSARVHTRLMKQPLIGKSEKQISNWIEAGFLYEDMQWTAYETIVGAGNRSTLLHARATDAIIRENDCLLVDAGGEWKGYCADITRTIPAGCKFSARQSELYHAVLAAQKGALVATKPGTSLQEIHQATLEVLVEELMKLNLPKELVQKNIASLMPHQTSHWIGLDVHDPSPHIDDSGDQIKLAPGMCFTIEPGLYFRQHELFTQYCGIGVRIEDDVLITESDYELLTPVPKELEEIEELRSSGSGASPTIW